MAKVTRIAYSQNLNQGKYLHLQEMARRLAQIRKEVWHRYGSINGVQRRYYDVRDEWMAAGREFDLLARVWKATLADVMEDINAYREAAKVEVRKAIRQRYPDEDDKEQEAERIRLYTLLKYNRWTQDDYLRRMMRKHFKHGKTDVDNQIVLDKQCYTAFLKNGQGWIDVTSLVPRKRIAIPLNTSVLPQGTIRLILREERVEVHYATEEDQVCITKPCGDKTLGIDKGYTEVFVDSEGDVHGEGLGQLLSKESDFLKEKYVRRNKIRAVAEAKPHKAERIRENNLGRQKLDRRKARHTKRVKDKVYKAVHAVVNKAETIGAEDLTAMIKGKSYSKNQNRRLSSWVKGIMAEALESVTRRRRSTLVLVNAAYSSQTDSRHGILLGERKGDLFYCFDGVVLDADQNAACVIQDRMTDTEIHLYTPYKKVKEILLERTEQFKLRTGYCSAQDSSYIPAATGH